MLSEAEAGRVHVAAFEEVPQIDIGPLFRDDEPGRHLVGDAVRDACIDVGFFYIRNHGVPQATVEETFRQMALFFAPPEDAKREIHASKSRYFRGYSGLYEERHDATTDYYEPHEVIDFGRENEPGDPPKCASSLLYGHNLRPSNPPALRRAVEAYYAAMLEVSNALLRAFSLALDLPEAFFRDKFDRAAGALRLLHYPPQPPDDPPRYPPVLAGAHVESRLVELQNALMEAKRAT